MKLARELEKRLERLVDGISAAVFRGKMHPVDLANRLVRAVDLSVEEGVAGPTIDNHLTVRVHPNDLEQSIEITDLQRELAAAVSDLARERGWRTHGPVHVMVQPDVGVGMGSIKVDGAVEPGPQPAWAQLLNARSGQSVALTDNRVSIGRAEDNDVRLGDAEVSRHHAVLFREEGSVFIEDLGSVNGTSVNGSPVGGKPVQVRPGDEITLGPATFSYRPL